jgi:hypothetical protein
MILNVKGFLTKHPRPVNEMIFEFSILANWSSTESEQEIMVPLYAKQYCNRRVVIPCKFPEMASGRLQLAAFGPSGGGDLTPVLGDGGDGGGGDSAHPAELLEASDEIVAAGKGNVYN